MKNKDFDHWNEVKKRTEAQEKYPLFKEREIFNARIGENVGFEQCGKGDDFIRPVLILKKLTKEMFFGIPLSTAPKEGSFFFKFQFVELIESTALLAQMKLFSSKRLLNKMGMIDKENFQMLKEKLSKLIFGTDFTSPNKPMSRPEGNCTFIIPQNDISQTGDFSQKETKL
ncbi:MAG TPA: toxin-antitoxin system protein [Flavobacterium sp.]|nr:toxin-antitoxin system protein [Flavobacterium sp.]